MKKKVKRKDDLPKSLLDRVENLYCVHRKDMIRFKEHVERDHKTTMPIMTYADYIVFLQTEHQATEPIPLSKFNYSTGTFEKQWGSEHRTFILHPSHSAIQRVEIEIQDVDITKMQLLSDKRGDILEDTVKVKITRYYKFEEGDVDVKADYLTKAFVEI